MPLPARREFLSCSEQPEEEPGSENVLQDIKGEVDIDDVNFSYVKDSSLIEDFSLNVTPGMRVAIVGRYRLRQNHPYKTAYEIL